MELAELCSGEGQSGTGIHEAGALVEALEGLMGRCTLPASARRYAAALGSLAASPVLEAYRQQLLTQQGGAAGGGSTAALAARLEAAQQELRAWSEGLEAELAAAGGSANGTAGKKQ